MNPRFKKRGFNFGFNTNLHNSYFGKNVEK